MPIIMKPNQSNNTSAFMAQINSKTFEQIHQYCNWSGIYDLGYFLEQAAASLFSEDKEWELVSKPINKIKCD